MANRIVLVSREVRSVGQHPFEDLKSGDTPVDGDGNSLATPRDYGSAYLVEGDEAATVVDGSTTFVKAAGTTTVGPTRNFTQTANNRLRYDGETTKRFLISFGGSTDISVVNTLVHYALAKNGTVTLWTVDRHHATASDHGAVSLIAIIELAQNDYIELFVRADKAGNLTVDHYNLAVAEI